MLPLSVAVTYKNHAVTLARTLESVRGLAAEVVGVDSGSTDGSSDLVRACQGRVVFAEWKGYIANKQIALDHCTGDWVLLLDCDESLEPDLRESIRGALTRDDPAVVAYRMNRKTWYAGGFLDHAWQPEWRLRLFRRGRAKIAGYNPHDRVDLVDPASPPNRIEDLAGTLRHDSFETMAEYLVKCATYAGIAGESLKAQGKRGSLRGVVFSPPGAILKQIILKGAWRDGTRGWLAAGATAAATLMKHLVLLEKTRIERRGERP